MVDNINQFTRAADLTMGEAEAFRAGWRAAIEAAVRKAEAEADEAEFHGDRRAAKMASGLAYAIRALEPPAPMGEPTGLEERGG